MRNQASTASFALFVIVLLGTLFWVLHQQGHPQWSLVAVLVGVLLLRAGLFYWNLQQQKKRLQQGAEPSIPKVQQRLGLDPAEDEAERKRDDLR